MNEELKARIVEFLKMAQYVATTLEPRLVPPFSGDMKVIREQTTTLLADIAKED